MSLSSTEQSYELLIHNHFSSHLPTRMRKQFICHCASVQDGVLFTQDRLLFINLGDFLDRIINIFHRYDQLRFSEI